MLGKRKNREYVKKIVGKGLLDVLAFYVLEHLEQRDAINLKHAFQFVPCNKKFMVECGKRVRLRVYNTETVELYNSGIWPKITVRKLGQDVLYNLNPATTDIIASGLDFDVDASCDLINVTTFTLTGHIVYHGLFHADRIRIRFENTHNLKTLTLEWELSGCFNFNSQPSNITKLIVGGNNTNGWLPGWIDLLPKLTILHLYFCRISARELKLELYPDLKTIKAVFCTFVDGHSFITAYPKFKNCSTTLRLGHYVFRKE